MKNANLRDVKGRIHSVESFGAVDGPGVRFVVFLQGCPMRCVYCHNPDSWDFKAGKVVSAGDISDEILKYRNFIKAGGVTLSGGEPLAQPKFAEAILKLSRINGFHTAVDTAGCIPLSTSRDAIDAADLVLLDIKSIDPIIAKNIAGSDMSGALELLNYREKTGGKVWIRHVLVPELTIDVEQAKKLGSFLSNYECVERVDLLPFHKYGEFKWEELGLDYTLANTKEPTSEQIEEIREIIKSYGLNV